MMRKLVLGLLFIVESRAVDYFGIEEDINDFEVPNNPDNSNINYVAANPRTNYFRGSGPSSENDFEKDTSDYDINGHKDLIGDTFDVVTGNFYLAKERGIEGEWNVVMKDAKGDFAAEAIESFAYEFVEGIGLSSSSIQVLSVYTSALKGFTVSGMTADAARKLAKDERVDFVEQNAEVKLDASTWGIDRIDQRDLPMDNSFVPINNGDGTGVSAYIIDTGIRITHDEFKNGPQSRASWGTNTVDNLNYDCNGHGTHVAGTVGGKIYGVAKNVNLVAVKVLNCNGSGTYAGVIAGVEWTMRHARGKKATANLSLGGGGSRAMDNAVRNLHISGVPTVVAAGNSNRDACNYSPAREPTVMTVGATNDRDHRASFSNYGRCLDLFAPGQNIKAAWKGSNSDYRTISGTSMASPHVCGAVALYLQAGIPSGDVENAIKTAASLNKILNAGTNSPNMLLYIGEDGSTCDRPWTNWYDRDNPSGSGDWEPINLANPVPCGGEAPLDIECQTTSGIDASITGEVITCNPNYGFKCVSRDQPDGRCNYDYKVKYQCCGPACERTWSNWYDRDDSSGTGDWEPLNLANPAPCGGEQPIDIECQTTTGLDAASTGEIITCNTSYGFRCVNKDQPDGRCNYDYKVRYRCCGPPCERTWTNWYDRDDSSGTGDWEPLSLATPVPCGGDAPVGIECKTTTGLDAASTGEVITCDPSYGFRCVNKEQPDRRCNHDYKVRYLCECNN